MIKNNIRKALAAVLTAGTMAFLASPAMTAMGATVGTATENINLRSTASWKGTVITVVETGETFSVISDDGSGWVKVSYGGSVGYLPEVYVSQKTTEDPKPSEPVVQTPPPVSQDDSDKPTYYNPSSTPVYASAEDAEARTGALKNYAAGDYYIYKAANGMLNISKTKGVPGGWINPYGNPPSTTKPVSTTPPSTTKASTSAPATNTPVPSAGDYRLTSATPVYVTADGAKTKTGAIGTYSAGNYYVYKTFGGMVNISKAKGVPGAWINPGTVTAPPASTTTPKTSTPTTTTPVKTNPPAATTTPGGVISGSQYIVKGTVLTYLTAADASQRTTPVGSYGAGTYYIYKTASGMINISRTPGVAGAWVNPGAAAVTPPATNTPKPSNDNPLPAGYVNYSKDSSFYMVEGYTTWYNNPGSGSKGEIRYGTIVKLLGTQGTWSRIEYLGKGTTGWIKSTEISKLRNMSGVVNPKAGGNGFVIGIDPGHGGPDTGAVGYLNGKAVTEAQLNFALAHKTRAVLENLGFTVVMSQTDLKNDDMIYDKALKFNQAEVDYAISIHHNAGGGSGSIALYAQSKNNPSADTYANEAKSKVLGQMISNEMAKVSGKSYNIGDKDFYGDKNLMYNISSDAPSVLLEMGYMDNYRDLQLISSEAGQIKFANAIANGLLNVIKK